MKLFGCAGILVSVSCSAKRGKTSSFSLGKKKQKPERHARFGKSLHSPHFRSGRARSRDVGYYWDGSRPACASPPRKRASGFACTPLRRRSALAGSWLRGRVKSGLGLEKSWREINVGSCNKLQSLFVALTDCSLEQKETPEMRSISHPCRCGHSWRRSGETANPLALFRGGKAHAGRMSSWTKAKKHIRARPPRNCGD